MANANWFYLDLDPFLGDDANKPEDCDCDKPGTLTDTLIGPLESFFGKEAETTGSLVPKAFRPLLNWV